MRISTWFRPLIARLSRPCPRRLSQRPAFRPRLEVLEDRLTPSGGGLLDPTFGSGGIVHLPSTTDNGATAVAVQPDGRVVVAGYAGNYISVQRLNTDGSLDTTFNKTGSITIKSGSYDFPKTVALQPDGKILIGGGAQTHNGTAESLVARVNPNGTLDTTFGNSRGLELLTNVGQVHGLAVLTDPAHPGTVTGIVAAARAPGDTQGASYGVYKLTPAGVPDTTFGSGGVATLAGLTGGQVLSVAVAPSGEIYLAGYVHLSGMTAGADGCVAAVTPTGALDRTFGGGAGYVLADPTGSHESAFYDLAIQTLTGSGSTTGSRLVTAGYDIDAAGYSDGFVSAYTLGGTLDTTFGSGGSFTYANPPGQYSYFNSLALEADGSIVLGGTQSYPTNGNLSREMLLGHLTAAGAADTSFGPSGTGFTTIPDGQSSEVWGVAIDPTDGDILACGYTYSGAPNLTPRQADILRLTAP
jgi:uncharacterized delta-60 repeat protein